MKRIGLMVIVGAFVWACSGPKQVENNNSASESIVVDTIEYDVETFDSKFESWYAQHKNRALYRSQEFYENWNRQYVVAWNEKCANPTRRWHFEPVVGYDPTADYGFEANQKLFYYFMYVEHVLQIPILPNGPHWPLD